MPKTKQELDRDINAVLANPPSRVPAPSNFKARVKQRQTGIQWARDRWQNSDDAGRDGPPMFDRQWLPGGTSEHAVTRILAAAEAEWRRLQTGGSR